MKWNVAIEVRNPAWLTWKRLEVVAATPVEAEREALTKAHHTRGRWSVEHEDYCPDDFTFRVIGIARAD